MRYIIYDVEIAEEVKDVPGGWSNPEAMGVSSIVAFDCTEGVYRFFYEQPGKAALLRMLDRNCAVGFNSIRFDSRVIQGNDRFLNEGDNRYLTSDGTHTFFNYDIMLEYFMSRERLTDIEKAFERLDDPKTHSGGKFNLDAITTNTLKLTGKIGHGAHAPVLYKQGKITELFQYNLHDVRMTLALFNFIRRYGYVIGGDGKRVSMPNPKDRFQEE